MSVTATGPGSSGYDDIEVVTFLGQAGIRSSNIVTDLSNDGVRSLFEGIQVLDYDEIVDRNEELVLLNAQHHLSVHVAGSDSSTASTQYGIGYCSVEVSASPARSDPTGGGNPSGGDPGFETLGPPVEGLSRFDDSIDLLGRPLSTTFGQYFSDSATGSGGEAGDADDSVELNVIPGTMARFHPRDELFLNGSFRLWNMDVAGVTAMVHGQHIYGVVDG